MKWFAPRPRRNHSDSLSWTVSVLPDFVTNAGGVLAQMAAMQGSTADEALEMVRSRIGANMRQVLVAARGASRSPYDAAVHITRDRVLGIAA